nr:proteasome subunit beta type-6 [Seculamonas ecuadoriensis]
MEYTNPWNVHKVPNKAAMRASADDGGQDWKKPHSMGTTIMAVQFDGGVVVGADSRTSTGSYVANRFSKKLTQLTDRIYCCRSGSAADTQAISDSVKNSLMLHALELDEEPTVKDAAMLIQSMCYRYKDQLLAGIICAGWDKYRGGQVYNVSLGGSVVEQPFAIGGSGSGYIFGYCDANYKPGMTRDECKAFVINAVSLAMSRDGSSGGVVRTAVIDENGVDIDVLLGNQLPYY